MPRVLTSIEVYNLRTDALRYYHGIEAHEAVVCAYAQGEHKDYNTWNYTERYAGMVEWTGQTVVCGDWAAKIQGLCPVCGEWITATGRTTDGRIIGSCNDAFTKEQMAQPALAPFSERKEP